MGENTMLQDNLSKAVAIIASLAANENVKSLIKLLHDELGSSKEQFVWKTLDEYLHNNELTGEFKSAWLFVIRKNTPSKAHYHPNSTQYTAVIKGTGSCEIASIRSGLTNFNPNKLDTLYVIPKGTPHEFFPGSDDLIVISLHTCKAEELIEIDCSSGSSRNY